MNKSYNPFRSDKVAPDWTTLQYDLIIHETEKAKLVLFGDEEVWLPKSQCDIIDETYSLIQTATWLVEKRKLEKFNIDQPHGEVAKLVDARLELSTLGKSSYVFLSEHDEDC